MQTTYIIPSNWKKEQNKKRSELFVQRMNLLVVVIMIGYFIFI